ncbi:MAG TPA: AAA family ATPase [Candidatus Limnocylindrales bacterium]
MSTGSTPKARTVSRSRLAEDPPERALAVAAAGRPAPIRVLLVEDMAEVAAHVRDQLNDRSGYSLVEVLRDSRQAVARIGELDVDVVIVDTLVRGRIDGATLIDRIRKARLPVGIVAVTVADRPLNNRRMSAVDAIVTMPFGTYDLLRGVADAHRAATTRNPMASSRTIAVFAAKGGVGTTTIAYNLAASLQATGLRTILVDGSLQFGDLRRLLRIPEHAASILDLPTDTVLQSDVAGVVFTDPSGLDVLPAPQRPEMAELMTTRDLPVLFELLCRMYQAIVIDTSSALDGPTLTMLDAADVLLQVVTPDPATIEAARLAHQTFAEIGYPPGKLCYLVNRVGSVGGLGPERLARALGREPEFTIRSDWQLVAGSNSEGVPFVHARPDAPVSLDVGALAEAMAAVGAVPPPAASARTGSARPNSQPGSVVRPSR